MTSINTICVSSARFATIDVVVESKSACDSSNQQEDYTTTEDILLDQRVT